MQILFFFQSAALVYQQIGRADHQRRTKDSNTWRFFLLPFLVVCAFVSTNAFHFVGFCRDRFFFFRVRFSFSGANLHCANTKCQEPQSSYGKLGRCEFLMFLFVSWFVFAHIGTLFQLSPSFSTKTMGFFKQFKFIIASTEIA